MSILPQHEKEIKAIQRYSWWLLFSKLTYNIVNIMLVVWSGAVIYYPEQTVQQPQPSMAIHALFIPLLICSVMFHASDMNVCMSRGYHTYLTISLALFVCKLFLFSCSVYFFAHTLLMMDSLVMQGLGLVSHIAYDIVVGSIRNTGYTYDLQPHLPYTCKDILYVQVY